MIHVVSSAKIGKKHQERLRQCFPAVSYTFCTDIGQAEKEAAHADVLITYGEDLNDAIVKKFPRLRWIHVISAGVEWLPFDTLRNNGIRVSNARGIHAVPMGEYAMAVLLQLTRRVHHLYLLQQEKHWDRTIRMGELCGKTLAIIGAGAIGQAVAKRARAFDIQVWGMNTSGLPVDHFDRMFTPDQREMVFSQADYVLITLPLTPRTRHFVGERELRWMKPDAYLINMARGSVVNEESLLQALRDRRIGGAVLDVFEREPLPADHPFWDLDNVLLTPHLSGRSPGYMTRALDIFQENLSLYLKGDEPLQNELDLLKGY
ncbi:D-2-hydroxyacid dehydrogenase [Desmospora profundinema]|uniref:Phosphoglycerate dehydrogenase-like enzyme n=1 Tax=Desmospora profundinema TaxID=1571184 RepID=A0ABU1ISA8_9BACL|nr:D-2-hydroxyacid dehydrogenase [Desmospora profundinema]MDR6227618.1 phosphoglycerate dehydrogenase-like enzyme [Desmospora profundinema]